MNVSCNSSVSGNVHVDVLFQYAMILVVLLLYIDETKIKIINLRQRNIHSFTQLMFDGGDDSVITRYTFLNRSPRCQLIVYTT